MTMTGTNRGGRPPPGRREARAPGIEAVSGVHRPADLAVGVAGLGYMGIATALGFARHGVPVRGFDIRPELLRSLRRTELPIHEEELGELLRDEMRSGRFQVVGTWEEMVDASPIIFLCLPTPRRSSGRIDLAPLRAGLRQLGSALRRVREYRLVVVKSTVVPGTTQGVVRPLLERSARKGPGELGVAVNPEFLAEGTMVRDALEPARIVIGIENAADEARLRRVHATFPAPVIAVSPTGAELVKYASNAFLALKVSFANEISRLAERTETDVGEVMAAVGLDPRIGPRFLSAGPGFGGSCFEKDVRALIARGTDLGVDLRLLKATLAANAAQTRHAADLALGALGDPHGSAVALLGLSFKPGTDDVRESRALPIAETLARAGARVRVHDPVALERFKEAARQTIPEWADRLEFCVTVEDALRGADLAVLHTDWTEYSRWPSEWSRLMRRATVVDLRRALPVEVRSRGDFKWIGLGSPAPRPGPEPSGPPMPRWLQTTSSMLAPSAAPPAFPRPEVERTAARAVGPIGRWSVRRS